MAASFNDARAAQDRSITKIVTGTVRGRLTYLRVTYGPRNPVVVTRGTMIPILMTTKQLVLADGEYIVAAGDGIDCNCKYSILAHPSCWLYAACTAC